MGTLQDYIEPSTEKDFYTIYSKSGCPNCTKAKKYLASENNKYLFINCDEYLIENKNGFLEFIKNRVGKEYNIFPIIFHNEEFIGGYNELIIYKDKISAFFGEMDF